MPKSTFIESIQDFHVWHQWVECRTILTPRVIMRSREVLWVEIATDTRERRLCPYEFHWTPGTRPRLTKTARSQDSLLGALWSYNGNSSETFTEKLTTRHFKLFPPFIQSQFYKQKLGNKVGAEERPRTAAELRKRYSKIVISLPFTFSKNPYFVLRETKMYNAYWLCFIFLFLCSFDLIYLFTKSIFTLK